MGRARLAGADRLIRPLSWLLLWGAHVAGAGAAPAGGPRGPGPLGAHAPVAFVNLVWFGTALPALWLDRAVWGRRTPPGLAVLLLVWLPLPLRTLLETLPWVDRWLLVGQALALGIALGPDQQAGRLRPLGLGFLGSARRIAVGQVPLSTPAPPDRTRPS